MLGRSSTSTHIKCIYNDGNNYVKSDSLYQCWVRNNPRILTQESAQISSVNGLHEGSRGNDGVLDFHAQSKTIKFFPKGLEKFFKNLKLIQILACQLQEIHQSDLKVFPNLTYLYLNSNDIEVIEEGLFDFNPKLEYIEFYESKIIHVDPNVLDNLTKLRTFLFPDVSCVKHNIENSKEKVQKALNVARPKCTNSDFVSLENQIKNLEIESKTLKFEDFNTKLEIFEKILKNSKFSKFRPLNYKFEFLKNQTSSNVHQIVKIESPDTKFVNLGENLKELITNGQNQMLEELHFIYNELKPTLDVLKSMQFVASNEKFSKFETKLNEEFSTFGKKLDKFQNLEDHFVEVRDAMGYRLNLIEEELTKKMQKMSTNFNEKIDGIQKNLIKKFDEVLDEKLGNLNNAKLRIKKDV